MNKKWFCRFRFSLIFVLISVLIISSFFTTQVQSANPYERKTETKIYLPLVVNNYPHTPEAPTLENISNSDGDGNFSVTWSSEDGASSYLLQEDDNINFTSPTNVYQGANTTTTFSGKAIGTYFYRAQASNSYASSGWSNIEQVSVSVAPTCPQEVTWFGPTSQGGSRFVEFFIENTSSCQIQAGTLSIDFTDGCAASQTIVFTNLVSITNNHFETSGEEMTVAGDFSSGNEIAGTFNYTDPSCPVSGTWSATANFGANDDVYDVAVDSNGKILAGGAFKTLGGGFSERIGRINTDGSLDSAFATEANYYVNEFLIQPDQKILVGGRYSQINGESYPNFTRLNSNGTIDTGFAPAVNDDVYAIALDSENKILIGGNFDTVGGESHNRIARVNPNGTVDSSFTAETNGTVFSLAVQDNGKIIVGGSFTTVNGVARNRIARLETDGSLDTSFNPGVDSLVRSIQIQSDQKILVGGSFTAIGGSGRNRIARLETNGTLDTTFNPNANGTIYAVRITSDQKILLAGSFTTVGGEAHLSIAKINANGSPVSTFTPSANDTIFDIAIQTDGTIIAGGGFTALSGETNYYIGRINADGSIADP